MEEDPVGHAVIVPFVFLYEFTGTIQLADDIEPTEEVVSAGHNCCVLLPAGQKLPVGQVIVKRKFGQ